MEYSLVVMGFKVICDENVSSHFKLKQKVASTRNLRSNNNEILTNVNQQSKTFKNQTGNIFNKLPTNIRSVEAVSVFKTKVKGNAQFVQEVTCEPLMDFKQDHYGGWKYYKSCYY